MQQASQSTYLLRARRHRDLANVRCQGCGSGTEDLTCLLELNAHPGRRHVAIDAASRRENSDFPPEMPLLGAFQLKQERHRSIALLTWT